MVDFEKRPITWRAGDRFHLGHLSPGMIGGMLLVLLGTLLFIDNLDILPFSVSAAFWPLAVLAYCGTTFVRSVNPIVRVATATGVIWAFLMLLDTLHIIRIHGALFWPLALIAIGIILLMYRLKWQRPLLSECRAHWVIGSNAKTRSVMNKAEEVVLLSGVKRRVESISFEGGDLTAVFGSIELDLRHASISTPDRHAVIVANTAFGSIELRIPESWQVQLEGYAVFGAYEDKTIPPRPDPGSLIPTLVIRGNTAFGAVIVRS